MYPDVSRAYFEAVHAVLTHRKTAETAAAELERKLTQITGLKAPTSVAKEDSSALRNRPAGNEIRVLCWVQLSAEPREQ